MRALPLLLLTLLAGPAAAQRSGAAVACKEDQILCKEDCTIEYGSSSRTYNKLGACLSKCQDTFDMCKERHFALQEREFDPAAAAAASPPPPEPPKRYTTSKPVEFTDSSEDFSSDSPASDESESQAPAAASREEPKKGPAPTPASPPPSDSGEPVVRRGVYRASEPEPARPPAKPAASSASKPEPTPEPPAKQPVTTVAETDPTEDEASAPPPPPPKPKVTAPARPSIPPEPKRKDISEWDPDAED